MLGAGSLGAGFGYSKAKGHSLSYLCPAVCGRQLGLAVPCWHLQGLQQWPAVGPHWCFWYLHFALLSSMTQYGTELPGFNLLDLTKLLFSWANYFSKIEFYFLPSQFVKQFYTWVIWKWHEKWSQWREGHATGSVYRAEHLLKHTLFAQALMLYGQERSLSIGLNES